MCVCQCNAWIPVTKKASAHTRKNKKTYAYNDGKMSWFAAKMKKRRRIAYSEELKIAHKQKQKWMMRLCWSPNTAEFRQQLTVPIYLREKKHCARICFVGLFDTIHAIASRRSPWSFVFIVQVTVHWLRLSGIFIELSWYRQCTH